MKKIYLIRHAKSSWDEPNLSDFDRGLNARGKRDIPKMAERLKDADILPDLVVSSPAKRAKKTAQKISKIIGYDKENIFYEDSLYESGFDTYLHVIQNIDDKHQNIFLFAHNMTITDTAERLGNIMIGNMPTCSIICIEFDCDSFKDIKPKSGKVLFFDFPKSVVIAKYQ